MYTLGDWDTLFNFNNQFIPNLTFQPKISKKKKKTSNYSMLGTVQLLQII